jgi:transcriptional regulator with XRE-family HTH domain
MQALSAITANTLYSAVMSQMGRPTERKRTAFGERLVAAREAAGLSQRELADKLGMKQRALCWWEREPVALRPDQLAALTAALGVSADYLLGRDEEKKRGTGPTGKAKKVFDQVSRLPRHHQQKIVSVVEDMLTAHRVAANA